MLAADHRHRSRGLRNPGSLIPWPGCLSQTAARNMRARSASVPPLRRRSRTVSSSSVNRAVTYRAVGGEPEAVAGAAEGLGDARDESDLAHAVGEAEALGGCRHWRRRPAPSGQRAEMRSKTSRPGTSRPRSQSSLGIKRHELDEAHDASRVACERGEVEDLVVVAVRAGAPRSPSAGVSPAASAASMAREDVC